MECPVCRVENNPEAQECRACGARLVREAKVCPQCNESNPPEALLCHRCGASLVARRPAPAPGKQDQQQAQSPSQAVLGSLAYEGYVGFWVRAAAWLADSAILILVTVVLAVAAGGLGYLGLIFFRWAYYVFFTGFRGQTLGKMLVGIRVVNEQGQTPSLGQAALREIPGKFLAELALGLGYVWAGWDDRKQGWHDKLARTFVIRTPI